MRNNSPLFMLALLCACSGNTTDGEAGDQANNNLVATDLERLQQGDKTLCADKGTLLSVTSVLADMWNQGDAFQRMNAKGENLPYDSVSATGNNKDTPELSCSGSLILSTMFGQIRPIIEWKLRPNLSNPGTLIIEARAPANTDTVGSAFYLTMADKYPAPRAPLQVTPSPTAQSRSTVELNPTDLNGGEPDLVDENGIAISTENSS